MPQEELDTSKKIERAALSLVAKGGYANVSMRDIAREAGVALSQINYHYRSKEGLFIALGRRVRSDILEDVRGRMAESRQDVSSVDFLCAYATDSILNDTYIHRLRLDFSNMAMWSPLFREEFRVLMEEFEEVIAGFLAGEAERKGHTPKEMAHFFFAFILGVSTQYLADGDRERAAAAMETLRALMK